MLGDDSLILPGHLGYVVYIYGIYSFGIYFFGTFFYKAFKNRTYVLKENCRHAQKLNWEEKIFFLKPYNRNIMKIL
jgi:hypothetical protein